MTKTASSSLVAALLLAGCASTGVIPTGQNTYTISKKDGSPGVGVSLGDKVTVYKEAGAFCKSKGLEVKTITFDQTPTYPFHLGVTELEFSCVPPLAEVPNGNK
jgi:hypothetical protein